MKKKKSNTPNTPNAKSRSSWLEKLFTAVAVIAFVWTLIASFFPGGKLGPTFWIATAFLVGKLVISGFMGRSFTYYVKRFVKKCREAADAREEEDDDEVVIVKCSKAGCAGKGEPGKHCPECGSKFVAPAPAPAEVKCSKAGCSGKGVPGKFCPECGAKFLAAPAEVKCSRKGCTGKGVPGKHCPECGAKFLAAPAEVKCPKKGCPGKGMPGKFCPECGELLGATVV